MESNYYEVRDETKKKYAVDNLANAQMHFTTIVQTNKQNGKIIHDAVCFFVCDAVEQTTT